MPKNTDGTFTLCGSCPTRGQCAGHNVCGISHTARLMYDGCSRLRSARSPAMHADDRATKARDAR